MATVLQPNASCVHAQRAELVRLRSKFLGNDRILGPAWTLLIKLISRGEQRPLIEVCDLIAIPDVPATTAQRCLDYLLAVGLVQLSPGTGKRFRSVELAPHAAAILQTLLAATDPAGDNEDNSDGALGIRTIP